jgi:hypothetical protein
MYYTYGSGSVGCLYDNGPHAASTLQEVIDALAETFSDIGESELIAMQSDLHTDGVHYFDKPSEAGADYCEVVEQQGDIPDNQDY